MPRNVFHASMLHLSPVAIEWLLRDDTYRKDVAHTPFKGGILMQCVSGRRGDQAHLASGTDTIFKIAPPETTHIYFHFDGPILSLPLFSKQEVADTYENPPFAKFCNDSDFAEKGYMVLCDENEFDSSPSSFEREANICAMRLRELETDMANLWELEEAIDQAYSLACGVEHVKLRTDADWSASDAAFRGLGEALDPFIDAFENLYSSENQYTENILLGTRSRICRSLRVSDEWRETLV
jgi:hypothetical protein